MWRGLLGKKIGMTQIFDADGRRRGVTVILAGPCPVLQLKTAGTDGYFSYQLGFDEKPAKAANKAETGHAAKASAKPCRFVREIRLRGEPKDLAVGQTLTVADWTEVTEVQVTARSKGKGYQGVMKRHGYHGLRATHGVKTHHRHPGSSGSLTPARTVKGRKAAGHMGDAWVTQKGLNVVKVLPEKNLIFVEGSVPGASEGYVIIRPAQPFQA